MGDPLSPPAGWCSSAPPISIANFAHLINAAPPALGNDTAAGRQCPAITYEVGGKHENSGGAWQVQQALIGSIALPVCASTECSRGHRHFRYVAGSGSGLRKFHGVVRQRSETVAHPGNCQR